MFKKFWKKKKADDPILEKETDEELNDQEDIQFDSSKVEELINEAENMDESKIQGHKKHFSDKELWKKIQKFAKKAGSTVVYIVLLLYFTMMKPEVPLKVKATIAGALGYFILPVDLIPDVAAGVGFADDLGALTAALITIAMYIDEDVKKQAKEQLTKWFGSDVDVSEVDEKLQGKDEDKEE